SWCASSMNRLLVLPLRMRLHCIERVRESSAIRCWSLPGSDEGLLRVVGEHEIELVLLVAGFEPHLRRDRGGHRKVRHARLVVAAGGAREWDREVRQLARGVRRLRD